MDGILVKDPDDFIPGSTGDALPIKVMRLWMMSDFFRLGPGGGFCEGFGVVEVCLVGDVSVWWLESDLMFAWLALHPLLLSALPSLSMELLNFMNDLSPSRPCGVIEGAVLPLFI